MPQPMTQQMPSNRLTYQVNPATSLRGDLHVPGDKSISHRAIMLASLATGETSITGFLAGADCLATLHAFRAMGVKIAGPHAGKVVVQGVGIHGLQAPKQALDLGNAGTAMRLLLGLLVAQRFDSELIGDASLSKRPMGRVLQPLTLMGAKIAANDDFPPLQVHGGQTLTGIEYTLPVASAQVKSAILLAGLYAKNTTTIHEPAATRDHTERMLTTFGCPVKRDGQSLTLQPADCLKAQALTVPGDISSAAFFLVGASIAPGSDITIQQVGLNPTRAGVVTLLQLMGADITIQNECLLGNEPVADIRVRAAQLHGITIPRAQIPLAIDEFPTLFIAAACAEGRTELRGARELRVKESDRLQVMATGLQRLGIDVELFDNGIIIHGCASQQTVFNGGQVDSHGDHRIAMAFAMASLRAKGAITISDCHNVATSFPNFVNLAQQVGLNIETAKDKQ